MMGKLGTIEQAMEEGGGVLRLAPAWVPRAFCRPGKRIKLHMDDYYVLGLERGGIDERWLSSTIRADNGPGTPGDEGLSYVVAGPEGRDRIALAEAVGLMGREIVGQAIWDAHRGWPMFSKFFDNMGPLPHHIHHGDKFAALVGEKGKPEMYFYPSQCNNHMGEFGYTFFGLNPGTTKEQVLQCLKNFLKGDNRILDLSRCYALALDTGFDVPPGVLHAPGSLCTYEPQVASDVYAMYQSVLYGGHCVPPGLLWKNTPEGKIGDYEYLIEIMDWETNTDPNFYENRFMAPMPARPETEMAGYREEWICYRCGAVSAKRLTVFPGRKIKIADAAAYGIIVIQGYGTIGAHRLESPTSIRYGQLTHDEYFITDGAAKEGVEIQNVSAAEPLVMLKHFAENPDLDRWKNDSR